MTKLLAILTAAIFFIPISQVLAGAAKCDDRNKLVEVLKKQYSEKPTAMALSQKSTEVFEFFTSKEGTWTVMMTTSSGKTCIMATGHSWKEMPSNMSDIKS